MRIAILVAATIVAAAALNPAPGQAVSNAPGAERGQPSDVSAAKRQPRVYRAPRRPGTQIACTRFGCRPIPPGCRIETEYNPFTWNPSGFDAVVCPR